MATDRDRTSEGSKPTNRSNQFSAAFKQMITEGWAPYPAELPGAVAAAAFTPARRSRVSEQFPGERLVVPAGTFRVRNDDCDYRFRAQSAFAHLTGLGTDREPDAVLVLHPTASGHEPKLYFWPRAPRTDEEFYASSRYGEMWVGQRESLDEMAAMVGFDTAPIAQLEADLGKGGKLRVLRGADDKAEALVDQARGHRDDTADDDFEVALSELRLIKDAYELEQMRAACAATAAGFTAVAAAIPDAVRRGRGERWVEGIFGLHARHLGNGLGYDTIAAGGDHATTLHWIRNDAALKPGELLLVDAGVELDSLYTADVTRTMPINGTFSPEQLMIYTAVLEAQQAGIDAARAGSPFLAVHNAAVAVVAQRLHDWGLLPVSVDEALSTEGGQHRRWMPHGTSHHLGLDVHDCAKARLSEYKQGNLKAGMVVTVEPGIYFRAGDLMVPPELRGIGVRIEDDVVITNGAAEVLSAALPRTPDAVETWLRAAQGR